MFSALSGWVSSAADAVSRVSEQSLDTVRQTGLINVLQSTTQPTNSAETAQTEQQITVKDFLTPPATWTRSSDEWQWCIKAALSDPNTCAITPAALKKDENLWQEIHSLVRSLNNGAASATAESGTATAESLSAVEGIYTPSANLVAFIQAHKPIYEVRSYVVPLFTSDENYWLNLQWRLAVYRLCTNVDDLLTVMRTLSKLPAHLHAIADAEERAAEEVAEANRAAAAHREAARANKEKTEYYLFDEGSEEGEKEYIERPHLINNSAYWREMRQLYDAEQEKLAWLREMQSRVKKEIELARGNVKLLDNLLQRQEAPSTLGVSVCDSCRYHKVKLSRLIGDICAAPEEHTQGTVLDSRSGPLFNELFQCNEDVNNVLRAYAGRGQEDGSGGSPKARATSISSSSLATPNRDGAAADVASAFPPPSTEAHAATPPKVQSATSSSAVELSAGGSVNCAPTATQKSDSENNNEDSFEAKLPWSMDD